MTIENTLTEATHLHGSCIYGPVYSWRVGWSLGVDLLLQTSICSFNCIYCQLGDIQEKTIKRAIYVPTTKVERDLRLSHWEKADIITLSGSGEPTLGSNLGEVIYMIKEYTGKPVMVLTNATTLHLPEVQRDLQLADKVSCKLDAASEAILQRMNRPVAGVTLESIVSGIKAFKASGYKGVLALQCMFMPSNLEEAEAMADLIAELAPDEVQLNTPKRPYPTEWVLESRGNHSEPIVASRTLRTVTEEQATQIEDWIKQRTQVPVVSVYRSSDEEQATL